MSGRRIVEEVLGDVLAELTEVAKGRASVEAAARLVKDVRRAIRIMREERK